MIFNHILSPFRTFRRTILSTTMKSQGLFTMRAFRIIGFAFCSSLECSICCEFGHSSAFPTIVSVACGNKLAQTDTLHLLRLPIRRQTSHTQIKQNQRSSNFNAKKVMASLHPRVTESRSYDSHRRHRNGLAGVPPTGASLPSFLREDARRLQAVASPRFRARGGDAARLAPPAQKKRRVC